MDFKGKVFDEFGNPLLGANVVTVFNRSNGTKAGATTDFDGVFTIGDAIGGENWKITHLGFEDQFFTMPRFGGEETFFLEEDVFQLEEFVGTPSLNNDAGNDVLNTDTNFAEQFNNSISNIPDPTKKSFLETLKDNPLITLVGGTAAILLLGFGLSRVAKQIDKNNNVASA